MQQCSFDRNIVQFYGAVGLAPCSPLTFFLQTLWRMLTSSGLSCSTSCMYTDCACS